MTYHRLPQEIPSWWKVKFWEVYFRDNEETGCIEWTFNTDRGGYGKVGLFKQTFPAHRMAYYLYYGVDPCDLMVRHKCNNRLCCNPDHLELGTAQDNADDRERSGNTYRGDRHWMHRRPEHFAALKAQGSYDAETIRGHAGANHANTRLNDLIVLELRKRRDECDGNRVLLGQLNREYAERYQMTESGVSHAGTGRTWTHLNES